VKKENEREQRGSNEIKLKVNIIIFLYTGYYMYIEASSPRRKGDNAVMETTVGVGSNACLTFYYNMFGFHIGTLNVRLGNQLKFTKSGPQGKQWIKAEVPLETVGTQKVGNQKLIYRCL